MKIICKNKDAIATGWVIANFPYDQTGLAGGRRSASCGRDSSAAAWRGLRYLAENNLR